MTRFLLHRLMWFAITLWMVVTLTFFLMHAVPGGPFDADRALNEIIEQNLEAHYHLDWPLWKQYLQVLGPFNLGEQGIGGSWSDPWGGVLVGDMGPSYRYRDFSVNDIIAQALPVSMLLGLLALAWALLGGVAAGILSALSPGSRLDLGLRAAATAGTCLPNFVIAGVLIMLFAFLLPLFPAAGFGDARHLVLPSLALGAPFAAYIARLTRTGMLEVLHREYILTARAKGLSEPVVVLRHALREGLLPVVSYLGPAVAGILTGSLVIEKIFFIPGIGSHFVNSALNRDYTLAMGVTVLYSALVFALNTLVDVTYRLLDPRVGPE